MKKKLKEKKERKRICIRQEEESNTIVGTFDVLMLAREIVAVSPEPRSPPLPWSGSKGKLELPANLEEQLDQEEEQD